MRDGNGNLVRNTVSRPNTRRADQQCYAADATAIEHRAAAGHCRETPVIWPKFSCGKTSSSLSLPYLKSQILQPSSDQSRGCRSRRPSKRPLKKGRQGVTDFSGNLREGDLKGKFDRL
jgi:hypothetical protein